MKQILLHFPGIRYLAEFNVEKGKHTGFAAYLTKYHNINKVVLIIGKIY